MQGLDKVATSIYSGREGSVIQEEAWLLAARDGGPEHYRPFVQAYGAYIYKTVYAVLHSPHDAEDVTQDVLLQIYRSLPNCRMDGLKTWITRIAVNRAIDFKRSKARRPEQLIELETVDRHETSFRGEGMLDAAPVPAAETVALREEELKHIQAKVSELPDNYREVVTAFYIEEKSYEQIASETGLELKSVESRLYRARGWMKRHWRKEDFE
ncbi:MULTISPECIES: RNA polymerase sigma factor [unclassified Paenibacillus]|uniref:RNA polymerase sigma factor n=1 Tax=unclassified Paenibacillus TaxID=185978 RepID=UPI0036D322FE